MINNSLFNIKKILNDLKKLNHLRIIIKHEEEIVSFYVCNHHLGDLVIFCSIAKSLAINENRKFIIMVEEQYQSVPKLFGLKTMVADIPKYRLPLIETLNQLYLQVSNLFSKYKIFLCFPGFFLYIKCPPRLLYSNMYIRFMISLAGHVGIPLSCIDETFMTPPEYVKEDFILLGLRIKRTVIISPDSLSMKKIDESFFIKLYRALEETEYIPIINSNSKFWNEIGFKTFFPDTLRLVYYAELAGYSISARSGISDVLSFTPRVKNIVIYGNNVPADFIIGKDKAILYSEIEEFFYTTKNEVDLIKNIISSLKETANNAHFQKPY